VPVKNILEAGATRMDYSEIQRDLSFSLLGREDVGTEQPPRNYSRIFVINGHQVVINGSTLFVDGEPKLDLVVYASRAFNKLLASTEDGQMVSYCFDSQTTRRYASERKIVGCKEWREYIGVLYEDNTLRIYSDGKCIGVREGVKDFELPEDIVGTDGGYPGALDVERIFRLQDGRIVVVERTRIRCNGAEIENMLHKGDFDYPRDDPPQYYRCSFKNVHVLASSNSSRLMLLTNDFRELELDEEIKVLMLRADDDLVTRYLSGMDYWGGCVYLIDDGGVVTRFRINGMGSTEEERKGEKINFVLDGSYQIRDDWIVSKGMEESLVQKKDREHSPVNGSEHKLVDEEMQERKNVPDITPTQAEREVEDLEARNGTPGSPFSMKSLEKAAEGRNGPKSTGNSKLDRLLDDFKDHVEELIHDFRGLRVEKTAFHLYKHNSNDLCMLNEQTYKNIMNLESYRSIEKEIAFQSNYILQSIETLESMNEEHIRSTIRYIDSAISSGGRRRTRRPVHYTSPLYCGMEKIKGIGICMEITSSEVRKTLGEAKSEEETLQMEAFVSSGLEKLEEKKELPRLAEEKKASEMGMSILAREEALPEARESVLGKESAPIPQPKISASMGEDVPGVGAFVQPQMDIFGRPVAQHPELISGILQSPVSSIFQSVANAKVSIPAPSLSKDEDKKDEDVPNAFSRFVNSRSMFR
jgi:hypothetical protein